MALIELSNIIKRYCIGDIQRDVLKNISLNVTKGEMLAIVGTSGSGKSTLMNLIGLLDSMDEGEYQLQNRLINGLRDDERARLRNQYIGFVFQQFNLLPRFTAIQNVTLPLMYRQLSSSQTKSLAMDALTRVGMQAYAMHRPTQLSGGQQQRVAIARALVTQPEVILADEPTGALDTSTRIEIMNLFLNLHKEGRTIIIVTHDEQIAAQCMRQIRITDGEIVQDNFT